MEQTAKKTVMNAMRSHRKRHGRAAGFALALAVTALAAALVAACGSADTARGDFAGYWTAVDESQLGGQLIVRIDKNGDAYSIRGFRFIGRAADQATIENGELVATGKTPTSGSFTVKFSLTDDGTRMKMALIDDRQPDDPLVVIGFVPAKGSEQDLAAQLAAQEVRADATVVEEGIRSLQAGIKTWATDHNDVYPPAGAVRRDGSLGQYVDPWPVNPYAGRPMRSGDRPGDYAYERLSGGTAFRLTGHLAGGNLIVVP